MEFDAEDEGHCQGENESGHHYSTEGEAEEEKGKVELDESSREEASLDDTYVSREETVGGAHARSRRTRMKSTQDTGWL